MRQFITNILKFGALAVVFYMVALFAFGLLFSWKMPLANLKYFQGSYGHLHTRLDEVRQTRDVDILFLGSSKAYRGFDPRIFKEAGYTSFNLGSSAQTPLQTKLLLERYLDRVKPRMVVYEVYPSTLSNEGIESALDVISNDKIDLNTFEMVVELCHTKITNTFLYGLMRGVLKLDEDFQESMVHGDDTYVMGGFVEKKLSYFRYRKEEPKEWRINDEQFRRFEKVVEMIENRDIPIVLVNAPIASGRYDSYTNSEEIDQKLSEYGKYYNFNELMSLDDSLYFYDASHLNQRGVELFNHKLIEVLSEDHLLPRDDAE